MKKHEKALARRFEFRPVVRAQHSTAPIYIRQPPNEPKLASKREFGISPRVFWLGMLLLATIGMVAIVIGMYIGLQPKPPMLYVIDYENGAITFTVRGQEYTCLVDRPTAESWRGYRVRILDAKECEFAID